ncbi:uncharacterized protein LOC113326492 [Papaver somniferum]|uniref:uncharacterized protein LOC113326492 n=1 Tax=Papaver somniferum TaxID=3469 RepID=UPI000E705A26|nr:uncharacterized protein LOC113326492 [Papaver somniferum]
MPRHPTSSRSRSASTRSASTTPRSSEANWTRALLNSQGSPSTDGDHAAASPSEGSHRVSSSNGDHSPIHGNGNQAEVNGWHEAFHQENIEADNTEENRINDDHLLEIQFNALEQPIEDGSEKYATTVGTIARNIVPPCIEDWRSVPCGLKEEIWRVIKNEYKVPEVIKCKALRMENKSWKNIKTILKKWCDRFSTVAERKNNRPQGVKSDDWEKFVKMHDSEEDQKLREIGKESKKLLKVLHTTGRDGIARRRHIMEQQSPTGSVSRTVVYLATNVYQEIPQEALDHIFSLLVFLVVMFSTYTYNLMYIEDTGKRAA